MVWVLVFWIWTKDTVKLNKVTGFMDRPACEVAGKQITNKVDVKSAYVCITLAGQP